MADLTSKVSLARLQEAQAQAQQAQEQAREQAQARAHAHKAKSYVSGGGSNASRCSRDTRSEADLSQEGSENLDVGPEGLAGSDEAAKGGKHERKLGAMRMLKRLGSASRWSRTSTSASAAAASPPHAEPDAGLEDGAPPGQL